LLVAIGLSEIICAWQLRRLQSLDRLPTFADPEIKTSLGNRLVRWRPSAESGPRDNTIEVATIGGSSARGVPFTPKLSLDRIITWQLGRVFPDRKFHALNRAIEGIHLEEAIKQLRDLEHRPDILIIYSGHNEFQSRFGWGRKVPYYRLEPHDDPRLSLRIREWSSTANFLGCNADRFAIEIAPPPKYDREPADTPSCTEAEYAATLADYRRRLDALLDDCEAAGILSIVVVPPSNEIFDPNRSILSADTIKADQIDFMARYERIRHDEPADPAKAMVEYRRLIQEQPRFADAHYHLARLLEKAGDYARAHEEYLEARDLDGCPFRCQTPFLDVCRELGAKHGSLIVDGPRLLEAASPSGIADDRFFADAHHPGLNTFVILARDAIHQLKRSGAFDWPAQTSEPEFSMADCVEHFGLDTTTWIKVVRSAWSFHRVTSSVPRDPSWRLSIADRCSQAIAELNAGKSPEETGLPWLRLRNELRVAPSPDNRSDAPAPKIRAKPRPEPSKH
jgi:hypothetical protein